MWESQGEPITTYIHLLTSIHTYIHTYTNVRTEGSKVGGTVGASEGATLGFIVGISYREIKGLSSITISEHVEKQIFLHALHTYSTYIPLNNLIRSVMKVHKINKYVFISTIFLPMAQ